MTERFKSEGRPVTIMWLPCAPVGTVFQICIQRLRLGRFLGNMVFGFATVWMQRCAFGSFLLGLLFACS
jgi:hypothetical protein